MVNKELFDYIKSVKEKGYKDDAIKEHLSKHGYSSVLIDEAFNALPKSAVKPKNNRLVFYILIGVILLSASAVLFFSLNTSQQYCSEVSVKIYEPDEVNSQPVLCIFPDNSKMMMILQNNGTVNLSKIDINVKGEDGQTRDEIINIDMVPSNVFPRIVNIIKAGPVKEINIIPYMSVNQKQVKCTSKQIKVTEIKICE